MGVLEANPGVGLLCLWVTGVKQQPLHMWMHATGVKGVDTRFWKNPDVTLSSEIGSIRKIV
jgi:hypothetical protein